MLRNCGVARTRVGYESNTYGSSLAPYKESVKSVQIQMSWTLLPMERRSRQKYLRAYACIKSIL